MAIVSLSSAAAGRNSRPTEPEPLVKSRVVLASGLVVRVDRRDRRTGTSRAATSVPRRGTPQIRAGRRRATAPPRRSRRTPGSDTHPPMLPFSRPTARCDPITSTSIGVVLEGGSDLAAHELFVLVAPDRQRGAVRRRTRRPVPARRRAAKTHASAASARTRPSSTTGAPYFVSSYP